ncbi:MAG: translation initiation factor Sui1 [Gemmatimonadales bacterium]|nr:translation initiation factor Sui1 [Gemmatimonadales bacterium]
MMARKNDQRPGSLVYSSEGGRMCPGCNYPVNDCRCRSTMPAPSGGPIRVSRETKGRKGKGVTVVTGLPLAEGELVDLGKKLKQKCGAGGTVKNGIIEIQGDHRDTVVAHLQALGYKAKRSGG